MAISTIPNLVGETQLTVTLKNNFHVASGWGFIQAFKIGGMCVLTMLGLYRTTAVTSDTELCTISGITAKENVAAIISAGNTQGNLMATGYDGKIKVNNLNANANYLGMIVFPI